MKLLIDNDFLLKMVAFGLLDCVLAYFKVSESDVRILPTARYKFFLKNPEKGRSKYGPVFDQLAATIERFAVLEDVDHVFSDQLAGTVGLDAGEVQLLAGLAKDESALFLTGDKRCVRAIRELDNPDVIAALVGRVWCLEVMLGHLILSVGFEEVRARVVPNKTYDKTVRAVFGSGLQANRRAVAEALESYTRDLHNDAGDLLAGWPLPPLLEPEA